MRTHGISPKVIADLIASAVAFALSYFAISLDPATAAVISKLIGTLAGYLAGPGAVGEAAFVGKGSDAHLPEQALRNIPTEEA